MESVNHGGLRVAGQLTFSWEKLLGDMQDVDVAILRIDEKAFRTYLKSWELWPGLGEGQLEDRAIALDEPFPEERGALWCRPSPADDWAFELLLNPSQHNEWFFKRDTRVRKPLQVLGSMSDEGIPYLNPETVLLFKAKRCRTTDRRDLEQALPHLNEDAVVWLRDSLQMVHPGHPWLAKLQLQ